MLTLAGKELRSLFASPLAWVVLAALQFVFAWVFLMRLDSFLELQPQLARLPNAPGATEVVIAPLFSAAAVVLLMATPLLSMRLIAEERRNQTLALLYSAPLSMRAIALGKFAGLALFLLLPVAMATSLGLALYAGTSVDLGLVAANALGLALLAATFSAVGLFVSSLTAQPVVAAAGTLAILLASWLASMANPDPASAVQLVSVTRRFESFNAGLIDSADVLWHLAVIALFLALTVRRLDRDRLLG